MISEFLSDYKSAVGENIKELIPIYNIVHKYRKHKNNENKVTDILEHIQQIEVYSKTSINNQNIINAKQGLRHLIDGLNSNVDHVREKEFLMARDKFNTLIHLDSNLSDNDALICIGHWGNFMYFNQFGDYNNALVQIYECTQKNPQKSIKIFLVS